MKLVFTVSYWWFVCFSYRHLSPASGGFAPRPPPGLCLWTPLGDFCPPDHLVCPPYSKFLATPLYNMNKHISLKQQYGLKTQNVINRLAYNFVHFNK